MNIKFDIPKTNSSIIKVFGVGGGGGNAVNYMFRQGIKGVDFVVCNTDAQALELSPVPIKLHIGSNITEGRGAGSDPEVGRKAAIENIDDVKKVLSNNTKMIFITAGMGGGTGTGAAPIIAKAAKDMGILTVGIVTSPFEFEGKRRLQKAYDGLENLKKNVDTLLVVNNERLRDLYGNFTFAAAFGHADNILATAAKGIAEIITVPGYINVDFEDVKTVMANSGVAIMGSGIADGDDRALKAVSAAMDSPLLNDNDIQGANYVLLNITSGKKEITMDEISTITNHIRDEAGSHAEMIFGHCTDEHLGDNIMVTIIATGFESFIGKDDAVAEKVIHTLEDETVKPAMPAQPEPLRQPDQVKPAAQAPVAPRPRMAAAAPKVEAAPKPSLFHDDEHEESYEPHIKNEPKPFGALQNNSNALRHPKGLDEVEKIPAYVRKDIKLKNVQHSSESEISRYTLNEDSDDPNPVKSNSFLHDNID
jgi:cell division protein FtsZ